MERPLRMQVSALLLVTIMPLSHNLAADTETDVAPESLRQEVMNLSEELTNFTADRRERLMSDIKEVIGDIDARIAAMDNGLDEKWTEVDRLNRVKAQTALASLKRERARVGEWYERMEDSADYTWESMKEGFNDAYDNLTEAWLSAEQGVNTAIEED